MLPSSVLPDGFIPLADLLAGLWLARGHQKAIDELREAGVPIVYVRFGGDRTAFVQVKGARAWLDGKIREAAKGVPA